MGEHNDAVASDLGYEDEELELLRPSLYSAATADKKINLVKFKYLITNEEALSYH